MKPRAAHKTIKTIGTVSAGVALVLAGTVAWLLNKPATGDCGGEAPTNHKVHEIRATKVVVQPWLGEHHVYGIFMVPNRYKHSWQNVAFAPQSGSFTAEFDATPQNAAMAGVVGLSNGPAADYSSLAAIVRFNTSSMIDARNEGVYAASAAIPYSAGTTYHFRLVVSVPAHTYSVYVQSGSTAEQLLASNFSFRTEQAAVSVLNNLGLYASVGSETVCRLGPTCVIAGNKNYSVVTMAVRGFDRRFAVGERADKQYVDDVLAEPEHYLLRIYVPTRVALWFLVNGLFGDLRRPCDWTLVFMERAP